MHSSFSGVEIKSLVHCIEIQNTQNLTSTNTSVGILYFNIMIVCFVMNNILRKRNQNKREYYINYSYYERTFQSQKKRKKEF